MNEMDTRFANQYNIQWFPGHMTKTLRMMEQEQRQFENPLLPALYFYSQIYSPYLYIPDPPERTGNHLKSKRL